MILHGLSGSDDSGLSRLAAGGAIDTPVRRRDPKPEWWMRVCIRCLFVAVGVATLLAIMG